MFFLGFQAYGQQISGKVMSNGEPYQVLISSISQTARVHSLILTGTLHLMKSRKVMKLSSVILVLKTKKLSITDKLISASHSKNPAKNLMR